MKTIINGIEIELTPEQIKKVKQPKKLSKERTLLNIFNGLSIKIDKAKYPQSIFFFRGEEYMFELEQDKKTTWLWCRYKHVWQIFEEQFGMNYTEIQEFIKGMVEEHFKMSGITPNSTYTRSSLRVEEHFKMSGITPSPFRGMGEK